MGSVIKCMAVYEEPFWRDDGLSGQAVSLPGPAQVVFDNTPPNGSPGLIGFLEGREARELGAVSEAERREAVLKGFQRLFGRRAAHPSSTWTRTGAPSPIRAAATPGVLGPGAWTGYGRALREPVGRIHWAGTETATRWMGYMDGAIQSGQARRRRGAADRGISRWRRRPARGPPGRARRSRMRLIDVRHLGRERVIGCWEIDGVLIDPGPTSSMDNLIEALGGEEPRALLLTHIHLDHAGRIRQPGAALAGSAGLRPRARALAIWRTRRSCWRAPSGSTATRWSGSGARWRPSRRRT